MKLLLLVFFSLVLAGCTLPFRHASPPPSGVSSSVTPDFVADPAAVGLGSESDSPEPNLLFHAERDVGVGSYIDPLESNLLFQAEQDNDVASAEKLLKHGSDPYQDLVDSNGVVDFAATDGHVRFVRLLLHSMPKLTRTQAQAYIRQAKNVALDKAVTEGSLRDAESLLDEGADVNNLDANDSSGVGSPLMRATSRGSLPLMRLLFAHGADANLRDQQGRTALMYTSVMSMYHDAVIVEEDVPPARLMAAPTRLLLQHGANIALTDHGGQSALLYAAKFNPSAVSVLLAHGANVDKKDHWGRTALFCAATVRDHNSLALLLAAGAAVDAKDRTGATPLMRASVQPDTTIDDTMANGQHQSIALLLKHGANPRLKDNQRKTRIDYAKMNDSEFIAAS